MMCDDLLLLPARVTSTPMEQFLYCRNGSKRMKLTLEMYNSDDEIDEWLMESIPERVGLRCRSMWMHPMNLKRPKDGEFIRVCVPYRNYPTKFFQYFRISTFTFDYILASIEGDLVKYSNRPSISSAERLAVTLR